jgi:hypothetical protein
LLVLYIVCLFKKIAGGSLRGYDLIFPLFVVFYLLFPDMGGNRYGPRYYFDAYPFFILTITSVASQSLSMKTQHWAQRMFQGTIIAHLVIACATIPALAFEMHRIVNERMEVFDLAKANKLTHAIVIVRSPTGTRYPMEPQDLTRNGINVDGDVLYARDSGSAVERLRTQYPDRRIYIYERADGETGAGILREVAPL